MSLRDELKTVKDSNYEDVTTPTPHIERLLNRIVVVAFVVVMWYVFFGH